MAFIVDSTRFQAEGALLDWNVIARRLGLLQAQDVPGTRLPRVLQLRWTLRPGLGLPTEPFTVWVRDRKLRGPKPIAAEITPFNVLLISQLVDLKGSYMSVDLNVSGAGGVAYAFVGSPWAMNVVAFATVPGGNNLTVSLAAPSMEGLFVPTGVVINSIQGVPTGDLSAADGWKPIELVGLPVKKTSWADQGIGQHGADQGFFGSFADAASAAKARLERGAPPVGWAPLLDTGVPAPPWTAPQPDPLIADLNAVVLDDLRGVVGALPPAQHAAATVGKPLPPPENSSGQQMSEPGSTSSVSPLASVYMAAAVDCFPCLALGFGTAYRVAFPGTKEETDLPNALDFDYMITTRYEKGPSGDGAPVEYAALVPTPAPALPPPVPSDLAFQMMGNLRPLAADGSWRATVRISWDRPLPIPLFRPRSFAFARAGVAPPTPPALLMNQRPDGSPIPIAVNYLTSPNDPEPNRSSAVDREILIPNDPGTRSLKYAVAHQDIYGQWSKWGALDGTVDQPGVDQPRIVAAELRYTAIPAPPNTKCAANLVLEFLWDWRVRTPRVIHFRGRLYSASFHGQPPPNTSLPAGLQTKVGVAPVNTFTLRFDVLAANGAPTSTWPGYNPAIHAVPLNPAGDQEVTFGSAQGAETRRYRITIPGFELDFGPSSHVGLALWGKGQEAIAPQNDSDWSAEPSVISTSDPRPPVIAPDIVTLSSLPDAAGESHAVLKWSSSPGADGYFIYETTETKLRRATGLPEPDPALTLSERLTVLLGIFDDNPAERRAEFTRRNSRLIKASSADVTLPRGSTAIHLFTVLGVSGGQVEAAWPATSTALYTFAVPRVPAPGAPTIEASSFLDPVGNAYRARIRVETRKGPRVKHIDLHRVRVDDAAKNVDTMGPPVATIDEMTPAWNIAEETDALGTTILTAAGIDTPSGSWKRVWYRAVAWSGDDPLRGTLATRSPASTTAWVVVPPAAPPDLSPIVMDWPGTAPPDVRLSFTSAAPIAKTPLGVHRLAIRVKRAGAAPEDTPLVAFDGALSELTTEAPATGSGAWRIDGTKPAEYRAMVRRADVNDEVQISVRITDPLGRSSEQLATIAPGHIMPDPELTDFVLQRSVTPAEAVLSWLSGTPLDPPPYTLRVTVHRPPFQFGFIQIPRSPISILMPLGKVPSQKSGTIPPGRDPVLVRRLAGPGPVHSYFAVVRVPFTHIVVRLQADDGRFAQHIQPAS